MPNLVSLATQCTLHLSNWSWCHCSEHAPHCHKCVSITSGWLYGQYI